MSQVILVGHGSLAVEMKKSAEMIFGELDYFHTVEHHIMPVVQLL